MFVVDTNILIYAADQDCDEHELCHRLLSGWRQRAATWHITWTVVYEFLRTSTHPRILRHPFSMAESWRFVTNMTESSGLKFLVETERHAQVAVEVLDQVPLMTGNILFDAHTAILMKEHGIRTIYTHDTDFHRFPFLEVIDPLAAAK